MIKSKIIFRKLNIVLVLVLVLSFSFTSIFSSADEQWSYMPNHSGTKVFSYDLAGVTPESGKLNMNFVQYRYLATVQYAVFDNARFDYTQVGDGTGYVMEVDIGTFPMQELVNDFSDATYWVRFNYAIGNASQIFTMPSSTKVRLYRTLTVNADEFLDEFDVDINGNVAYVRASFKHTDPSALKMKIYFSFGTEDSDMIWSSSTHFWCTGIYYGRGTDIGDVKDAIDNQTDAILGADGDGSIHDSNSALKDSIIEKDEAEKSIDDIRKELEELPKPTYNPDSVSDLNPSFEFIGQSFTSIVLGFGIDYQNLWWILVSLGLFGSCFGVVLLIFRR